MDHIRWMKRFGYLPDVSLSELDKLDDKSSVFRSSLRVLQSSVYTVEQIGYPDGVLGARTKAAMTQSRCAHPDFVDEELADADKDKVAKAFKIDKKSARNLIEMHFAMRDRAIGSGSWPQPCQKAGITVSWSTNNAPRGLDTDKLFDTVAKAYRDIGANVVRQIGTGNANIRVTWEVLQGSVIGLAQFNSRSCSNSVFCKLDPGYFPNFLQVCGLLQHEWGHNMNLEHTRGGVMNPSIVQFNSIQWGPNDPSYNTLVRFFGGEPIDTPTPVPPTPIPEGEGRGVIMFGGHVYEITQTLKKV